MPKIFVLYYSQTGNTEKMANAVAEGARNGGSEVEINYFIDAAELGKFDGIIVGTSTYHHDMPMDIKRLFEEAAIKNVNLKGKVGAVFGSFGWSGEAPKLVNEILKNKFEMKVTEPPLLCKYTPDQNMLNSCKELGNRVSKSLMH